ncbi:MAG TPA: 3-deoxy-7-phosphoheptulonate synthase [Candidatus Goldiibacteriota bacterium]|nr:3-deoxy-7-phosphoheptulonate synthase [Candidatus Goldiibacteriota bacterium]HRQ43773.1 3-deoxy-7-phosphoheptulonate synthase [Candidatus Goldiibacteriota bacterium]
MIIVLKPKTTKAQINHIVKKIAGFKLRAQVSKGKERTIIAVIGDERVLSTVPVEAFPGVEKVMTVLKPYKLASKDFRKETSVINLGLGVKIGGNNIAMIAGPCSVESREQLLATAKAVKAAGANVLRGGAFKPRTSPYAFQGMAEEGLKILAEAREMYKMPVVTEVLDTRHVELVNKYADCFQIGARNMQNFELLKEVGKMNKPVLLKRGLMSTVKEWLMSAEYILANGNMNVILCERGIRTFETETRNTLDLSAIPLVKTLSHLPVVSDPSHGTGKKPLIYPMALASVAAGADGVLIEVHPKPETALSDGDQSLLPVEYKKLVDDARKVAKAIGRTL